MSKSIPRATIRSRVCTILLLIGLCAPAYAQQGETSAVPVGTTYAERRSIAKSLDLSAASRRSAASRSAPVSPATSMRSCSRRAISLKTAPALPDRARAVRGGGEAGRGRLGAQQGRTHPRGHPVAEGAGICSTGIPGRSSHAIRRGPRGPGGATVAVDEANLQTARINLGYTQITSPIAGRIGRTSVTKGNVVGPDSGRARVHRQPGPDLCRLPGEPARIPG